MGINNDKNVKKITPTLESLHIVLNINKEYALGQVLEPFRRKMSLMEFYEKIKMHFYDCL